ncbi:MAG: SH3 domain-containing protein [Treponema sp.]
MKRILFFLFILSSFFLISCKDKVIGYSVVLWNNPEQEIKSGDVLPVYIKSNISHVYIAGKNLNLNENEQKIEIPLWQLTEPVKKNKLSSVKEKYQENARTYANVKTDGLPCRAEPVNTAKQVYRLRKGEIIKILYKGNGQSPMTGGKPLPGEWYKILTDNGTTGWCFSYNLDLFETDDNGNRIGGNDFVDEVQEDEIYKLIVSNVWYPEEFRSLIDLEDIDLSKIHPSYRFTIDEENKKVSLNTQKIHESWIYEGYSKIDDREYELKNISIKIIYRKADYIVVRYTDETGKPQDLNFVTIKEDLNEIISKEKQRRSEELMNLWYKGPYSSQSYGKLSFTEDNLFKWTGFKLLVPSVIPAGSKNNGSAQIKYSVSKTLKKDYDGIVTFTFEGSSQEINFLYKMDGGGLKLEDTIGASFKGNQITSRGVSPVIIFFKRTY